MFVGIIGALPVIGAAIGTVGTVASVIGQNQQAQAQRDALQQSSKLSEIQSQQRLLALEQKRAYVQGQLKLDNMARAQEHELANAQLALQQQAINQQIQQESLNQQANALIIDQERGFATGQAQNQLALQQMQLSSQHALEKQARDFNFLGQNAGLELQQAGQFAGEAAQLRNQLSALDGQNIAVKEQVAGQLDALAREFQNATLQQRQALRQQAQSAIMLAGGTGLSQSDRALLDEQDNLAMQAAIEQALSSGRTQELLRDAEAFQLAQLQRQRQDIMGDFQQSRLLSDANVGLQRGQLLGQNILADTQAAVGSRLGQMNIHLPAQLQQLGIDGNAVLQMNLNDLNTQRNLMELGLDQSALEVLRQAQANSFNLSNEQAALNAQFGELALDANRLSVQSAGAAERAAINAQQSAITSPGAMGFLSTIGEGVGDFMGTGVLSGGTQSNLPPTNPLYRGSQQQASTAVGAGGMLGGLPGNVTVAPRTADFNTTGYGPGGQARDVLEQGALTGGFQFQ